MIPRAIILTKLNAKCYLQRFSSSYVVFDRKAKLLQRERAISEPDNNVYDYLRREASEMLIDNVYDIKRKLDKVMEFGCGKGYFSQLLTPDVCSEVIMCDSSSKVLEKSFCPKDGVRYVKEVMDEENLQISPNSLNLVVNCLSLHWVNNLPETFRRIIKGLKPDGAFLATMFSSDTLYELRSSLQLADLERHGGISPHISPFVAPHDIGSLLNQAGFALLTIQTDKIVIGYPSMFELMWDLKGMGENNASINRCGHLSRDSMLAASVIYQELYGEEGKIPATFNLVNFIAWKPDPSQPKPLPRGSAELSFKDLDKINEIIKEKGYINLNDSNEDDNNKK